MNIETIKPKQLQQIHDLAEQLLFHLNASRLDNELLCTELATLLVVITDEQQTRLDNADRLQQASEAADKLANWDNEGGAPSEHASRRLLSIMRDGKRQLVWADEAEKPFAVNNAQFEITRT